MNYGDTTHGVTLDKDKLQKMSLLIATPMFGGNCTGVYAGSLLKLGCGLQTWGIPFSYLYHENDSLITRARNKIVMEFLNSEATYLLLLDGDIGFEAGNIIVMLAHDKKVIGAPYPRKRINWEKVKNAASYATVEELEKIASSDYVLNYQTKDFDHNKAQSVPEIGTGCLLLHRSVFDDMIDFYGERICYRPMFGELSYKGFGWSFFDCGKDESGYYQPEDYTFCQRWKKMGGEIWMCPWMTLTHRGQMNFTGNMKYQFLEGGKFNVEECA